MSTEQTFNDVQSRPAHTIPKSGLGVAAPTGLAHFHHPGYDDIDESELFTLPTCSLNNDGHHCTEHMVAEQGCYAMAICQSGFFTKQRSRASSRVHHGQGFTEGHYWYHLDDESKGEDYATLIDFRQWRYRPEEMPDNWREALPWRGKEDDDQEDSDCCITGEDGGVQKAHLVEKTEWQWWIENNMTDYAAASGVTRTTDAIGQETTVPGNLVPLSDGLHRMWDSNFFCLFPLPRDGKWHMHCVFLQQQEKTVRKHHRRPLRGGLRHTSPACAWARFVLSIYRKYAGTFLAKSVARYLGGSKLAARNVSGAEILQQRQNKVRNTSPRKKSRSGSPRKRTHSSHESAVDEDDQEFVPCAYSSNGEDSAVDVAPDTTPRRGRKKRRDESMIVGQHNGSKKCKIVDYS